MFPVHLSHACCSDGWFTYTEEPKRNVLGSVAKKKKKKKELLALIFVFCKYPSSSWNETTRASKPHLRIFLKDGKEQNFLVH